MPSTHTWQYWLKRLYNLRRDKTPTHERPHKPVLLLSILDLLDRGLITRNEIFLNQDLARTFKRYFEIVRQRDDRPSIENPFFHLCTDGFWHLLPAPGRPPLYEPGNAGRTPTTTALKQAHARFDENFWTDLLTTGHSRYELREALIARYFPEHREQLAAVAGDQVAALREEPPSTQRPARDAAFRTTILELYDHTCAACGRRLRLDPFSLIDAAHIIPVEVQSNDRPDNGLALCPNHHRAMDAHLIAPCPHPDLKAGIWRVSRKVQPQKDPSQELLGLRDRPVLEPNESKFLPAKVGLEYREQKLGAHH